jgi:putative oxidoreductase
VPAPHRHDSIGGVTSAVILAASDASAIDLALVLLRVAVGAVMIAHGYNHIWGPGTITGTAQWFESIGMRPSLVQAWLASVTELGAGVLLIAGLATPLAAAGVIGVMAVAWIVAHRGNGFFIFKPGQGWEYVMVLLVVSAAIAALGPGAWSLDNAFGLADDADGWTGLVVSLVAGLGGAAALLAACWRPATSCQT